MTVPKTLLTIACLTCLVLPACTNTQSQVPAGSRYERTTVGADAHPAGAVTLRNEAFVVEYRPDLDRIVRFKSPDGPEMLFTQRLDRSPLPNEDYTFFGGGYSWTAPQNGDLGWVGPDGAPRAWPPDPSMDIGPASVLKSSKTSMDIANPVNRLGLIERKSLTVRDDTLEVSFALRNTGDAARTAGTWINTAVHDDAYIAVRLVGPDALAGLRGWDEQSIDRFVSITTRQDNGWAIVDLSQAMWDGGIKVYVPSPPGELPMIAVWRDGLWMHRAQNVTEAETETVGRLRALGEGSVAVYIQPSATEEPMIVEAELYGPIVDIAPGTEHGASETWALIESPDALDTSLLPVLLDPASQAQPAG